MKYKYQIQFSSHAEKDLIKLPKKTQKNIFEKLLHYEKQNNPLDHAVKLTGTKNKYRFRIGNYRAVFSKLDDRTIVILLILKIAHRKEIYK